MPLEIFSLADAGSSARELLLASARALCCEYRDALLAHGVPIDTFQNFSDEIATLPSDFIPPRGGLWLALESTSAASPDAIHLGCRGAFTAVGLVALRDVGCGRGEIKRLFVRPAARRGGAASALSAALEAAARAQGFSALVLDSLERLPGARQLYERLGFSACGAYNANPMPDALWMTKRLAE